MNSLIKRIFAGLLVAALLVVLSFSAIAKGQNGISVGSISIDEGIGDKSSNSGSPILTAPSAESIEYKKIELTQDTRDFFASVDQSISITFIGAQKDFVAGDYLNYYYGYTADTLQHYHDVVNTLKTISELNTNVKLRFIDPFNIASYKFIDKYKRYKLEFGDIMISCTANFDGSPKLRNSAINVKDLFTYKKGNNKKIVGVKLEETLVKRLKKLSTSRDINVAYIDEISMEYTFEYVENYMSRSGYNIDNVSLKSEQLNGYDMIIICSPARDITLEELVLIDNFLSLGGNRSLIYLAPETYVELPLLNSFLNNWGISMNTKRVLCTESEEGKFTKLSQLYGKAYDSKYLNADKIEGNLIMDNCTPITIFEDTGDVKVSTMVATKSDKVVTRLKKGYAGSKKASANEIEDTYEKRYPLVTLSERETEDEGLSSVMVYSSVDFITTYFALRNDKTKNYKGSTNGNLQLFATVMNNINEPHRKTLSGLADYAVKLSEMGIDTTSGYDTDYIITFGIIAVAVPVSIFLVIILIFSRRKRNGKSKQS